MNVLAIGCHPDDVEICCAGTLAKCVKRGDRVVVAHLCTGSLGHVVIPPKELIPMRANEAREAGKLAGIEVLDQLGGKSAVETSGLIAELATSKLGMSANNMGAANVAQHYDALASAAFCGKNSSVLVLVSDANRSVVDSFVAKNAAKISQGYVFGGTGSVSDASMAALKAATK